MPANRDKNQRVTFVYSNLYQIYKKGQETLETPAVAAAGSSGVIKASDRRAVEAYEPVTFVVPKARPQAKAPQLQAVPVQAPAPAVDPQNTAIEGLKENLKSLNDLHSRLRFMLKELEELIKEE